MKRTCNFLFSPCNFEKYVTFNLTIIMQELLAKRMQNDY